MENQGKSVSANAAHSKEGAIRPKYLKLRGGTYYFMRRIPAKVVSALGLTSDQMWRSLWTSDLDVAVKALPEKLREFDELVASAKPKREKFGGRDVPTKPREQGTTKYLLEEHIPSILNRYEFGLLDTDDELRQVMTREDRAEYREMMVQGLEILYDDASANNFTHMAEIAEQLLSIERLIAPPGSHTYNELLKQLLQREIGVTEALIDRLRGKIRPTPRNLPVAPRDLPTMLDLVKDWSRKQGEIRTIETYASNVEEFEAINGALPVIAITKNHAEAYRDHLKQAGLWRATVKNRLGGLSTLVRHGFTKSLLSPMPNPFDNVDLDDVPERPALEDRRPYNADELNVLFRSPIYTVGPQTLGQASESSYWAPLLGPFVGARIEEIAQLRIEDVLLINGVWALRIANLGPDQTLKTQTSYRYVPLHEEVVRCGFLAYWAKTKKAGHERLFPSHKNENKYQRWSNALGKWYSGYLTRIGLNDERLCYHSFRFTFKQRCTQCGIESEVRDALTGHWVSRSDAGRGYMKAEERQYPFPALVAAINKLRYDELDLSHLYVDEPMKGVEN